MAKSPTYRPIRRSLGPSIAPEPKSPAQAWAAASMVLAWASLLGAAFCYDVAKPVSHAIDGLFGVSRRRVWDSDWIVGALLLAFAALVLAGASVSLTYSQSHRRDFAPPLGALLAGAAAVASVLYYAFKLA